MCAHAQAGELVADLVEPRGQRLIVVDRPAWPVSCLCPHATDPSDATTARADSTSQLWITVGPVDNSHWSGIVAFVDHTQADQRDHRFVVGDGPALADDNR